MLAYLFSVWVPQTVLVRCSALWSFLLPFPLFGDFTRCAVWQNNYAASSTFLACLDFILGLFGVIGFNVFSQLKFFFAVVFIFFKFILLFLILCWFTYCLRLIICYCHYFVSLICSIILLCCISPLFLLNKQLRSLFILYSLSNSDDFVNCDAVLFFDYVQSLLQSIDSSFSYVQIRCWFLLLLVI